MYYFFICGSFYKTFVDGPEIDKFNKKHTSDALVFW